MVGAENFKRRVNFGLIKVTALSFGNAFGFITIVCRIYRRGSRMATQKMLQPQPSNTENERRWGGVSRCCSVFGVTLTQFPPLGLRLNTTAVHRRSKRKNKEINKPPEKNLSSVQIVSQTSCLFVTKSTRRFAEIHCLRSKVGHEGGTEPGGWFKSPPSSFFPLLFQQKIDFFLLPLKAFEKRLLCRWLAQREPLSPVHGNERCAINWARWKGGAQQQGCGC